MRVATGDMARGTYGLGTGVEVPRGMDSKAGGVLPSEDPRVVGVKVSLHFARDSAVFRRLHLSSGSVECPGGSWGVEAPVKLVSKAFREKID